MFKNPETDFKESYQSNEHLEAASIHAARIAHQMEEAADPERVRTFIQEFLQVLESEMHLEVSSEVDALYHEMQKEGQLVRLETISKIFDSLADNQPINLGPHEKKYANAVIPEKEGLRIAFAEGEAPGPIRFAMGFDIKSIMGFDPEGLQVSEIQLDDNDPRDQVARFAYTRHVSGNLPPENIKTFVMRIPRKLFPPEKLTEIERGKLPPFIFRGGHLRNPEQ